jgi:hypothetical protein
MDGMPNQEQHSVDTEETNHCQSLYLVSRLDRLTVLSIKDCYAFVTFSRQTP